MSSSSAETTAERQPGRILTFYSYKGGTGRSMSLANVAWILASNGQRVLVIDWDLEAPGLHRYFSPFLDDPHLQEAHGVIDFFTEFVEGSHIEKQRTSDASAEADPRWFDRYSNLSRYAVALDFEFPDEGTLDFVCAGRQGPEYALKVNSFQWRDFYEKLGGGVFLETVKKRLRDEYDFILIDSRTGLSDTSGICTVQMPDDLVVCFTLNRQSIFGARDAARSADQQRRKPNGAPGLRIWPVPMRVELGEKDRLDAARALMRSEFVGLTWHLTREERERYWSEIEVLYVPYYAYEEVLATIADRPGSSKSLLSSMQTLTQRLTGGRFSKAVRLTDQRRNELIARHLGSAGLGTRSTGNADKLKVAVLYSRDDIPSTTIGMVVQLIEAVVNDVTVFWDGRIRPGTRWDEQLAREACSAVITVVFVGGHFRGGDSHEHRMLREVVETAVNSAKAIIPIAVDPTSLSSLPQSLVRWQGLQWNPRARTDNQAVPLVAAIKDLANQLSQKQSNTSSLDDPQKDKWGREQMRNKRALSAHVIDTGDDWFEVTLSVDALSGSPELGTVEFHLHPMLTPSIERVNAVDGRAELKLKASGAFTVGAVMDDGKTTLELDLSKLPEAPPLFRER